MSGSTTDEDGSHQEPPFWDYFKADNFTLGAYEPFHQYFWKQGRANIRSRQVVLKVAFPFNADFSLALLAREGNSYACNIKLL